MYLWVFFDGKVVRGCGYLDNGYAVDYLLLEDWLGRDGGKYGMGSEYF